MERKPCSSEELVEDIICFTVAIWKTTTHNVNSKILVEFRRCQGQILKMFDHLVSWERNTFLEIGISERILSFFKLSVGPGEDR